MTYRVVVAQPIEAEIVADLAQLGPVHMNPGPEPLSPTDLARLTAEAEGLMAFMTERSELRTSFEHNLLVGPGGQVGISNIANPNLHLVQLAEKDGKSNGTDRGNT